MWSEGEPLRSARLADWLGVTRPTVTIALRRMARDGMARLTRSKEIELTAAGMKAAEARETPSISATRAARGGEPGQCGVYSQIGKARK